MRRHYLVVSALLGSGLLVAGLVLFWGRARPTVRPVNIEAFRYGTEPCVIRANRGDRLILTFSSRDTGHSFLLQEYDIDAKITPGTDLVEVFRPSRPEEPPQRVRQVELVAGRPGFWGALTSKGRFRCHVYCGPMHGFEQGDLIVWPNVLLVASLFGLFAVAVLGVARALHPRSPVHEPEGRADARGLDLFARFPVLKRLAQRPGLPATLMIPMMAGMYLIVLTGLLGTKVSGRNFSVMVLWVGWLFLLTAVLVPLGGRLWCLLCPLPMVGDLVQRRALRAPSDEVRGPYRNRFFGLQRPWPRWLSNAWPRTLMFLCVGTFSTYIVSAPRATGWLLVGLFGLATVMPLVYELRAFCRYLCPISAFIGLYAMTGRLALRPAAEPVCRECAVHTCRTGSAKGWACPYGLCMAEVDRNNDCGLCTECVRTCAYDNVSLYWRPFASDRRLESVGEAFLSIAMLVLAVAYCLTHLGPWPEVRNWVDLIDRHRWDLFWQYAAILWATALIAAPALVYGTAWLGRRLGAGARPARELFVANAAALVPLGLMAWVAFAVPLIMVHFSFILMTLSDPFGWNWNLFGTAGMPWRQIWPAGIPWIQAGAILAGVGYTLRNALRNWVGETATARAAVLGALPLGAVVLAFGTGMLWFFTN